jgi:1,4-alpha-glucan branching enzyme
MSMHDAIHTYPPDKVLRMPEGSWGEQGNHSVWMNDKTKWIWEIEYRAEESFAHALRTLGVRKPNVKKMLERAARELLLLQASDWPFVIHSRGADDYGAMRFAGHATRFNRAIDIATQLSAGSKVDAIQKTEIDEMDAHDDIFNDIDLNWWSA